MRMGQKKKKETTNITFRHLTRHPCTGFRRIIHHNIFGKKVSTWKPEEEDKYKHFKKGFVFIIYS